MKLFFCAIIICAALYSIGAFGASCRVNERGIALVKEFEGFYSHAHIDEGAGWLAIGYEHNGPDVHPDSVWTEEKADRVLREDLQEIAFTLCQRRQDLNTNQLAALTSLAYNVGITAILASSLLKTLDADLFRQYCHSHKGQYLAGLTRRRRAETLLFVSLEGI